MIWVNALLDELKTSSLLNLGLWASDELKYPPLFRLGAATNKIDRCLLVYCSSI
jgi:hypothetical protein